MVCLSCWLEDPHTIFLACMNMCKSTVQYAMEPLLFIFVLIQFVTGQGVYPAFWGFFLIQSLFFFLSEGTLTVMCSAFGFSSRGSMAMKVNSTHSSLTLCACMHVAQVVVASCLRNFLSVILVSIIAVRRAWMLRSVPVASQEKCS